MDVIFELFYMDIIFELFYMDVIFELFYMDIIFELCYTRGLCILNIYIIEKHISSYVYILIYRMFDI